LATYYSAKNASKALLNEVAMFADNIDATFGSSRHFTDEESRQLLVDRIVPNSVRPYGDVATELLEWVNDLWEFVDDSYHKAWCCGANDVERRFIVNHALSVMRRK
jgi:hypothetical protein